MRIRTRSTPAVGVVGPKGDGSSLRVARDQLKRDRYARLAQPLTLTPLTDEGEAAATYVATGLQSSGPTGEAAEIDSEAPPADQSYPGWRLFSPSNSGTDGASASRVTLDMVDSGEPLQPPAHHLQARSDGANDAAHPGLRHNLPILLGLIVGSIIAFAIVVTAAAFLLRCCCGWDRRSKRRHRKKPWSPSMGSSAFAEKADDPLPGKSDKDSPLDMPAEPLPVVLHDNKPKAALGDVSTQDDRIGLASQGTKALAGGKGWSLYDEPVTPGDVAGAAGHHDLRVHAMHLPESAPHEVKRATAYAVGSARLGNGLPDLEGGNGLLPTRRPSLLERVLKQRGGSCDGAEAEVVQPSSNGADLDVADTPRSSNSPTKAGVAGASRFSGMGVNASRTVLSMIPATLRNAASTSRAFGGRNLLRPQLPHDSDFEGTIGAKDRDLPMARRIGKKAERFAMEYSTEEEHSPAGFGAPSGISGFPGTPGGRNVAGTMGRPLDFTPGMAGIGAAWQARRNEKTAELARLAEVEKLAMMQHGAANFPQQPLPALDYQRALLEQRLQWEAHMMGHPMADPHRLLQQTQALLAAQHGIASGRERLMETVAKWQADSRDAEPVFDPYTSAPPNVRGSMRGVKGRAADVGRSGSCRSATTSEVTSISCGSSITGLSAFYEGKGAAAASPADALGAAGGDGNDQLSRVPSIRPQFAATTTLSSWLDPSRVSTTHGYDDDSWEDVDGDDGRDPFASDVDPSPRRSVLPGTPSSLNDKFDDEQQHLEVPRENSEVEEEVMTPEAEDKVNELPMTEVEVDELPTDRQRKTPRRPSNEAIRSVRTRALRSSADKAKVRRVAKSGYSSSSGKKATVVRMPAQSPSRHRSNASSLYSAQTRSSARSSAALSCTGTSSVLSSLFDAEPKPQSQSRRHRDGDKVKQRVAVDVAPAARPAKAAAQRSAKTRERRDSPDSAADADAVAAPVEVALSADEVSEPSHADSSCLAPASERRQRPTRRNSGATMASFYSDVTAPEEYEVRPSAVVEEAVVKKKASSDSLASVSSSSSSSSSVSASSSASLSSASEVVAVQPVEAPKVKTKRSKRSEDRAAAQGDKKPVRRSAQAEPTSGPAPKPKRVPAKLDQPMPSSAVAPAAPAAAGTSKLPREFVKSTLAAPRDQTGKPAKSTKPTKPTTAATTPTAAAGTIGSSKKEARRPDAASAGYQAPTSASTLKTRTTSGSHHHVRPSPAVRVVSNTAGAVKGNGSTATRPRNAADYADDSDSPWSSSDSDISLRRWGANPPPALGEEVVSDSLHPTPNSLRAFARSRKKLPDLGRS
ncbi:hypothetical protein ACQY0O_001076 [Thecaphora frezii]